MGRLDPGSKGRILIGLGAGTTRGGKAGGRALHHGAAIVFVFALHTSSGRPGEAMMGTLLFSPNLENKSLVHAHHDTHTATT